MTLRSRDSFGTRDSLVAEGQTFDFFSLPRLEAAGFPVSRLPFAVKILNGRPCFRSWFFVHLNPPFFLYGNY